MKKIICKILTVLLTVSLIVSPSLTVMAKEDYSGYEGGIAVKDTGLIASQDYYKYQEVIFITGEPIVLEGTMTVKKSVKNSQVTKTYIYNLFNTDYQAQMTRAVTYVTDMTEDASGQRTEVTTMSKPSEAISIEGKVYTLEKYDFTKAAVKDKKPAINYYSGDILAQKTYTVGQGAGGTEAVTDKVTVETTTRYTGYESIWGSSQVLKTDAVVQYVTPEGISWGVTADIRVTTSGIINFLYSENPVEPISYPGEFSKSQYYQSILDYSAEVPQFDSKSVPTPKILTKTGNYKLETFPQLTKLSVPNLRHIKANPYYESVEKLYGLGALKEKDISFNPSEYMTRAEFVSVIINLMKEAPDENAPIKKTKAAIKRKIVSPYTDLPTTHKYFDDIKTAYDRGFIAGTGNMTFSPDNYITKAEALVIIVGALGLERLAPSPTPINIYKDSDKIPEFAKGSAYVAGYLGIIKTKRGENLLPNATMTKGETAELLMNAVDYMSTGILADYRDNTLIY